MRKTSEAKTIGELTAIAVARCEVEDWRFLDDTGRPLEIDDFVLILHSDYHTGKFAKVVGLDIFDDIGNECGDNVAFVRLTNVAGECQNRALIMMHPARLRYKGRGR